MMLVVIGEFMGRAGVMDSCESIVASEARVGWRADHWYRAGRDASRAFITGCFETHLTHDLRGLSKDELKVSYLSSRLAP